MSTPLCIHQYAPLPPFPLFPDVLSASPSLPPTSPLPPLFLLIIVHLGSPPSCHYLVYIVHPPHPPPLPPPSRCPIIITLPYLYAITRCIGYSPPPPPPPPPPCLTPVGCQLYCVLGPGFIAMCVYWVHPCLCHFFLKDVMSAPIRLHFEMYWVLPLSHFLMYWVHLVHYHNCFHKGGGEWAVGMDGDEGVGVFTSCNERSVLCSLPCELSTSHYHL